MKKTAAIATVLAAERHPTIFTTGYACRIALDTADRDNHFYMVGSMGLATAIAIGVAESTRGPVIAVDGDGSILMNPTGLLTAGQRPDLPLLHIALDDQAYESTGGQISATTTLSLCDLARGCGYAEVQHVDRPLELDDALQSILPRLTSPTFVHCRVSDRGSDSPPARLGEDLAGHSKRFQTYLQSLQSCPATCRPY